MKSNRRTYSEYCVLAKERGFICLEVKVKGEARTRQSFGFWQCANGHKWEATYNNIRKGRGCPRCAHNAPVLLQDYYELAAANGISWLGTTLPNSAHTPTEWQCSCGRRWEEPFTHVKAFKKTSCPACGWKRAGRNQRLLLSDYIALAAQRGFEWLDTETYTNNTKTRWRCSEGHEWQARYADIYSGKGCPHCAGRAAKTEADYHALATDMGFRWVGTLPKYVIQKTTWRCSEEHEWRASYNNIKTHGSGCPYCAGVASKTEADYIALAASRNLCWIGDLPPTVTTTTLWRCPEGHEWKAKYSNVKSGHGCPVCAGNLPRTAGDYALAAEQRRIFWIGSLPPNAKTPTEWQCQKGHIWRSSYASVVLQDTGCPQCVDMLNGAPVSKPQRAIHAMIGGELNYKIGRYAIDVALNLSGVHIAVEYDCWYWHKDKATHDAKRDAYLFSHGWRVLHVRSSELLPTPEQLHSAIHSLLHGETYAEIILPDWGG